MPDLFISVLVLMTVVQSTLCVVMITSIAVSEYRYFHLASTIHHKENVHAAEEAKKNF